MGACFDSLECFSVNAHRLSPIALPFICSLLFLTLADLLAASVNSRESAVLSGFLLHILFSLFISSFFLMLFHVPLQSWTETQKGPVSDPSHLT